MASRQRDWNLFEAVILLEGFLDVLSGTVSDKTAITRVSKDLRAMAIKQGEEIDEAFRNEAGISFQMKSMESAFRGYTVSKPATILFSRTVEIYWKKNSEYKRLLEAAKSMISGETLPAGDDKSSLKAEFMNYLATKISPELVSESLWCYNEIEKYFQGRGFLEEPLLETTDLGKLKTIKEIIELSPSFRFAHSGNNTKLSAAFFHYYTFVKNKLQSKENAGNVTFAGNGAAAEKSKLTEKKEENEKTTSSQANYASASAKQNSNSDRSSAPKDESLSLVRTKDDERLSTKYPIVFKRIFRVLWDSTLRGEGLTPNEICDRTQRIARVSDIEDILDNASWADCKGDRYWFSNDIVAHDDIETEDGHERKTVTGCMDDSQTAVLKREGSADFNNMGDALTETSAHPDEGKEATAQNRESITNENEWINTDKTETKYQNESYKTVLRERFRNGFRLNSSIEVRRFKKAYTDTYGKEPQENDEEIIDTICGLCVTGKDRAYLPAELLSDDLRVKLLAYIDKSFREGRTILYYSALCDEFAEDFLDYPLHDNPELLRQYLREINNRLYYSHKSFISRDADAKPDLLTEIRSCLKKYARPMKFNEIYKELPHLPQDKVKGILRSNQEFVNNGKEEYFHESILQLSDDELEDIAEIIDLAIDEKDFISGDELYNAIGEKYSYLLDNNQGISDHGFRDALKVKFGERFSFVGNIIGKADNPLSMSNVFENFASTHESFTLEELKSLADELGTPIYFDQVYKKSIRISREKFVSNKQARFSVLETDKVLDLFCPGDYISIQEVTNFGIFPDAGHPWNTFLLEQYVNAYSEKYKLLHIGFTQYECAGAIVKRSADIESFDDFIVDFLSNSDVDLKKGPALDLLARKGYIARRKYSSIEQILIRAKAQRKSRK